MNIDFNAFLGTLPIMAKGMAGIFIGKNEKNLSLVCPGELQKTKKGREKE